ncbi:MAG: hypothetical protein WBO28_16120 [Flavobacteriales bacterium]
MATTPIQHFGTLPDTLTFGPFGPDGDIIVHIENLVLGCPPYVENIGVPFVCAGEGYGSFVIPAGFTGGLEIATTTGYFSLRDSLGNVVTYPAGDPVDDIAPGSYCVFSSDEDGNKSGDVEAYYPRGGVESYTIIGFSQLVSYTGFNMPNLLVLPPAPPLMISASYGDLPSVSAIPEPTPNSIAENYATMDALVYVPPLPLSVQFYSISGCPLVTALPDFNTLSFCSAKWRKHQLIRSRRFRSLPAAPEKR